MSTELAQPIKVVNPTTGELLTLDAPADELGRYLADIREYESLLREGKKLVSRELLSRMDRDAAWTIRAGGFELRGQSPKPTEEYDALELRSELLALVDEGVLSADAVDKAIEPVVTYKPRKAGLNALVKLGGRVAEVVAKHRREVEKERYVSVSRA